MKSTFNDVAIEAIASTIPGNLQKLDENYLGINADSILKITKITGITSVAIAAESITAADLCMQAARIIFDHDSAYLTSIDVVIFVSQSRDYLLPTTSSILQNKLGLSKNTLCLDVPSGCTGYLHGLFLASTMIESNAAKKVLLLCGETNTKLINQQDKSVSMIFGDAGTATIVGKRSGLKSYFNLKTDGADYDKIIVRDGGCRNPVSESSMKTIEYENGNKRRPLDMEMDGMSVFNFAITQVPKIVDECLNDCAIEQRDVGLFAAHQANALIVQQIAKKCGFTTQQTPFLASKFGNTGPASIPLLLSEGFSNQVTGLNRVMMCGFGVGLNWGVFLTDLSTTKIFSPSKDS